MDVFNTFHNYANTIYIIESKQTDFILLILLTLDDYENPI